MSLRVLGPEEHTRWDRWVRGKEGANLRQLSGYGAALERYGHTPTVLVQEEHDEIRAGALLGVRSPAPFLGPLVHSSGGLVLADPGDTATVQQFLDGLVEWCRGIGAAAVDLFVRVPEEIGGRPQSRGAEVRALLDRTGFSLREPFDTYFVRLEDKSEDELLRGFGKNPRRHIRKAARDGLTVASTVDPATFAEFESVHAVLCRRKQLNVLPPGLVTDVILPMVHAGDAELFVATFRDIPRNYLVASTVGPPLYVWGALSDAAREDGCPQTGQALHYGAMCAWAARDLEYYDFGGTPGATVPPSHPNYSVWKFKREFEGDHVRFLGWWRRRLRPLAAGLYDGLRSSRRSLQRLTSRAARR